MSCQGLGNSVILSEAKNLSANIFRETLHDVMGLCPHKMNINRGHRHLTPRNATLEKS